MAIRFLIDESMPGALSRTVARHNQKGVFLIDAIKVGENAAPPWGTTDSDLLRWMEQERRILASYDKRTLPAHFAAHLEAGGHVPGIFLFKLRHSLPFIVEYLSTVAHASSAEEWVDRIVIVD
jgi:hypothetical protein